MSEPTKEAKILVGNWAAGHGLSESIDVMSLALAIDAHTAGWRIEIESARDGKWKSGIEEVLGHKVEWDIVEAQYNPRAEPCYGLKTAFNALRERAEKTERERDEARGQLKKAGSFLQGYQGGGTPEDVIEACEEFADARNVADEEFLPEYDGADTLADVINGIAESFREWQDKIQALVSDQCGKEVDGSGCDSGDPLDLVLAEIQMGFNTIKDRHNEALLARDNAIKSPSYRAADIGSALVPIGH